MYENQGTLYVVGTPIGNLGDISPRALEALGNVDFIAAEDTRISIKLLTRFNIKKPLLSCHKHNAVQRAHEFTERILNGESCAIITDAGMPCISDPGEELVSLAAERGINIVAVPGPCALTTALAISGLSTARFSFEGFLSVNKKQRISHLDEIKFYPYTLIFYEAPHKLKNTLSDLFTALGNRKIALCREITKLHEEVLRGCISDMLELYEKIQPKGEYVLVIEGCKKTTGKNGKDFKSFKENGENEEREYTLAEAAEMAQGFSNGGEKMSDACKHAAEITGCKKSDIYKYISNTDTNLH